MVVPPLRLHGPPAGAGPTQAPLAGGLADYPDTSGTAWAAPRPGPTGAGTRAAPAARPCPHCPLRARKPNFTPVKPHSVTALSTMSWIESYPRQG